MYLTDEERRFLRALDLVAPTTDDEASIPDLAASLGASEESTVRVAWDLVTKAVINTDAGLGDPPSSVEGRWRL
jgi:hypothetical protein